jgi:hypothetical protein
MVYPKSERYPARTKMEKKRRKGGKKKELKIETDEPSLYS